MKMELRINNSEIRSNDDGTLTVEGYVNKTNQLSQELGSSRRFREKIASGVFNRAIAKGNGVDFLAEHNKDKILATTRNGSLQLREDNQGLWMSATIANTSWGRDYYELVKSGILQHMSFGFRTLSDSWSKDNSGMNIRTINDLILVEVSAVREPAYTQSFIAARSIEIVEEPEIPTVEEEVRQKEPRNIAKEIRDLELIIAKQNESISSLEGFALEAINPDSVRWQINRQKSELEERKQKLSDLKQEQRKQEEETMTNENRDLQSTSITSTSPKLVSEIVKKLESTSNVYAKARKIPFSGEEMKVPYETNLNEAAFVDEGSEVPEIALNLSNFTVMTQKRVGLGISMSKQLMFNSGVDLSQHAKDLLTRRVGKALERSIISGSASNEFKGIAPDSNVTSSTVTLANPTIDQLRKIYLSVHEDVLKSSNWTMSRAFFEKVAQLKDGNGEYYINQDNDSGDTRPMLFGYPIEISSALADGNTIGNVPVIFGSIEDCYTVGVSNDFEIKPINDAVKALAGSVGFVAEFYGDGQVTNYQAVAKGVVA